jgi:hypothetical protein
MKLGFIIGIILGLSVSTFALMVIPNNGEIYDAKNVINMLSAIDDKVKTGNLINNNSYINYEVLTYQYEYCQNITKTFVVQKVVEQPTTKKYYCQTSLSYEDCYSVSIGAGTRCYTNADKSTWKSCLTGWKLQ